MRAIGSHDVILRTSRNSQSNKINPSGCVSRFAVKYIDLLLKLYRGTSTLLNGYLGKIMQESFLAKKELERKL